MAGSVTSSFACLTSIIAIAISIWSRISYNKLIRRQHLVGVFMEFTRRYQDIILSMPESVYSNNAKASDPNVQKSMTLYFDLCSEEYHLYKEGFIPKDVWSNWVEGMRITVKNPIYANSWKLIAQYYNRDFWRFMNHEIFSINNNNENF